MLHITIAYCIGKNWYDAEEAQYQFSLDLGLNISLSHPLYWGNEGYSIFLFIFSLTNFPLGGG